MSEGTSDAGPRGSSPAPSRHFWLLVDGACWMLVNLSLRLTREPLAGESSPARRDCWTGGRNLRICGLPRRFLSKSCPRKRLDGTRCTQFRELAFQSTSLIEAWINLTSARACQQGACPQTRSGFTVCFAQLPSGSIGPFWIRRRWSNGFRRTASRRKFTTWTRESAAPTRCRSRISPRGRSTLAAEAIASWRICA